MAIPPMLFLDQRNMLLSWLLLKTRSRIREHNNRPRTSVEDPRSPDYAVTPPAESKLVPLSLTMIARVRFRLCVRGAAQAVKPGHRRVRGAAQAVKPGHRRSIGASLGKQKGAT
ncbi:hypothetical protein TSUD_59510 [Trifolium subterraneum]|uniref:Uncharacterized protein n=1 Tax=Trifolium subterraneum TaxID=3900 RepID=A0A2Z6NBA1_TRISU|nr:hypothetical protein TSUD_59510 [Trifolium subterraneum]